MTRHVGKAQPSALSSLMLSNNHDLDLLLELRTSPGTSNSDERGAGVKIFICHGLTYSQMKGCGMDWFSSAEVTFGVHGRCGLKSDKGQRKCFHKWTWICAHRGQREVRTTYHTGSYGWDTPRLGILGVHYLRSLSGHVWFMRPFMHGMACIRRVVGLVLSGSWTVFRVIPTLSAVISVSLHWDVYWVRNAQK